MRPVGVRRHAQQPVALAPGHADCGGAAQQRGEQVPARLRRALDRLALAGEQQRAVELLRHQRLRAEALGLRAARLVAGRAALLEEQRAGEQRDPEHGADAREQQAQSPIRRARAACLAVGLGAALVQECALGRVELAPVRCAPVHRRGQAGAAVELGGVAPAGLPLPGRDGEVVMQAPALGVLGDPVAQARPLAQQRLVRDLDAVLGERDETAVGERAEHAPDLLAVGVELVDRHGAAHGAAVGLLAGQPQQDRARDLALAVVQAGVRPLGEAGDRTAHAARALVGRQPQMTVVAALPQLEQRRGQQRKRAGLGFDIGEQPVDELGLHAQPAGARRALDRPSQLTAPHRSHEHVVGTQRPAELAVLAAASVEVGAHGDDDGRGPARPGAHRRTPSARPRRDTA